MRGDRSQAAFAELVCSSQPTVRNYENDVRLPDSDFIKTVCNYFDVSADWLIFGIEKNQVSATVDNEKAQSTEAVAPEQASAEQALPPVTEALASLKLEVAQAEIKALQAELRAIQAEWKLERAGFKMDLAKLKMENAELEARQVENLKSKAAVGLK